jgi:lambda family phage portal protein
MVRRIAAGWDVSYEALANDREGVNYSSIRAGVLDERDSWRELQAWIIEVLCQRVFEWWLKMAWLSGQIDLSGYSPEDIFEFIKWHPRGFAWVDPLKDQQANVLSIENGTETQTQVMAEIGNDFEETMQMRKYEQDYIKALGVKIGTDTKGVAATASDSDQQEKDSESAKEDS